MALPVPGREKQFTDPGPYYYSGSGQFYSPQFVRSLSEAGQTSASGPGGGSGGAGGGGFSPSGMRIPAPSGSSGGLSLQSLENDSQQALQVGEDIYNGGNLLNQLGLGLSLNNGEYPLAIPLAIIGGAVDFLVNFFEDIFGGSDNPPTPRKLLHGRHPLYPLILGIQDGLIPDEGPSGSPQFCGASSPCPNARPLQRAKDPAPGPTGQHFWQKPGCIDALGELSVGAVGTALTLGSVVAALYLAPELFEGLEGLEAFAKLGLVAVPGATLLEQGAVGVWQKCF